MGYDYNDSSTTAIELGQITRNRSKYRLGLDSNDKSMCKINITGAPETSMVLNGGCPRGC